MVLAKTNLQEKKEFFVLQDLVLGDEFVSRRTFLTTLTSLLYQFSLVKLETQSNASTTFGSLVTIKLERYYLLIEIRNLYSIDVCLVAG